jgi:hypothetical protein
LSGGVASGAFAAVIHGLDGVRFVRPDITIWGGSHKRTGLRRRQLRIERITEVDGIRVTDGLQTLVDLASSCDDDTWEQALESALRKGLVTVNQFDDVAGVPGVGRVRRVLARRPAGAVPTGSILETRFIQVARSVPGLGDPVRQLLIENRHGEFVAFVDVAWPEPGLFAELDGQQHNDQPLYDARRQTAVTAATGWLCARFTWDEVFGHPVATARRLAELREAAGRRRLAS